MKKWTNRWKGRASGIERTSYKILNGLLFRRQNQIVYNDPKVPNSDWLSFLWNNYIIKSYVHVQRSKIYIIDRLSDIFKHFADVPYIRRSYISNFVYTKLKEEISICFVAYCYLLLFRLVIFLSLSLPLPFSAFLSESVYFFGVNIGSRVDCLKLITALVNVKQMHLLLC